MGKDYPAPYPPSPLWTWGLSFGLMALIGLYVAIDSAFEKSVQECTPPLADCQYVTAELMKARDKLSMCGDVLKVCMAGEKPYFTPCIGDEDIGNE